MEQLCSVASFLSALMLTCWSEHTELQAHRPAETFGIKSVYSADFTEVHRGNKLLRVMNTSLLQKHFSDTFTVVTCDLLLNLKPESLCVDEHLLCF